MKCKTCNKEIKNKNKNAKYYTTCALEKEKTRGLRYARLSDLNRKRLILERKYIEKGTPPYIKLQIEYVEGEILDLQEDLK